MVDGGIFLSIHMFITSSSWPLCQSEKEMKKGGKKKSLPDISEKIEAEMM